MAKISNAIPSADPLGKSMCWGHPQPQNSKRERAAASMGLAPKLRKVLLYGMVKLESSLRRVMVFWPGVTE